MISRERALDIETKLAQLLDVRPEEVRDYIRNNVAATARPTGHTFKRGTHGGTWIEDADGVDVPPGWFRSPAA